MNHKIVKRILTGEHVQTLSENIIYNDDGKSNCTHIELSQKFVQFEYINTKSADFQERAKLYFATDEELKQLNIPSYLVPIKVINLTNVGGGASIYYRRTDISQYLINVIEKSKKVIESTNKQNEVEVVDNNSISVEPPRGHSI